ncbi:MAG: hypothetical protein DCF28_04405 [Alphaproteobacteria bacterium]|nr:MAG: hypothetical protein DCF28_04405 [Alphaproteobacteria bacterium]PZO38068.1 MAG: hypothetical protein DCE92_06615 [Alphaproteobacteria bacterium]
MSVSSDRNVSPGRYGEPAFRFSRPLRTALVIVIAWTGVAAVLSLQGYLTSLASGSPQPWGNSFRYSLAIASVWAILTPFILDAVGSARWGGRIGQRFSILLLGFVTACVTHVALFSLVYWPFYGAGQHDTPWGMGQHMLVRNIGLNALFYGGLVWAGWRRKTPPPATLPLKFLKVRRRGSIHFLPLDAVQWIRAAGNYAEAITDKGPLLVDEPLGDLEKRLPVSQYARVHRAAIVRLDLIGEVRSRGRGDADLVLRSGDVVRLSRRYRKNLTALSAA